MSGHTKERIKVPEGKTEFMTTRQLDANDKGYIGYVTDWVDFHKEVKYTTPKRP